MTQAKDAQGKDLYTRIENDARVFDPELDAQRLETVRRRVRANGGDLEMR